MLSALVSAKVVHGVTLVHVKAVKTGNTLATHKENVKDVRKDVKTVNHKISVINLNLVSLSLIIILLDVPWAVLLVIALTQQHA